MQHDAGLVFLPDRAPYALAILTEWKADVNGQRAALVATVSKLVYQALVAPERTDG